jgi:hypothetical protein
MTVLKSPVRSPLFDLTKRPAIDLVPALLPDGLLGPSPGVGHPENLMSRRVRLACSVSFVLGLAGIFLGPAALAQAPTALPDAVDEILARNLEARGGKAVLDAVESIRLTSSLELAGATVSVVVLSKRPNLMRQELTVAGETAIEAFDGTTAWMVNRLMGITVPTELAGVRAAALRDQANFDGLLMQARNRGDQIELVGTEIIGGRPTHHLRLTTTEHRIQHCYLDVTTGLESRLMYQTEAGHFQQDLSDYRDVKGVKVPFVIKTTLDGRPQGQLTVAAVELNIPIDTALFSMPRYQQTKH